MPSAQYNHSFLCSFFLKLLISPSSESDSELVASPRMNRKPFYGVELRW